MKIYILLASWLNSIESVSNEIIAVCSTLEKARIILSGQLNEDLQYNDYENVEADEINFEEFDLYRSAKEGLPIPTNYIILYNGDEDSKYDTNYLEYYILETELI